MKLLELYGYSPQEPKNRLTELGVRRNYTTGLVSDAANRRQQQIKEGVLPQSNAPQRMPGSIVEDDAGNAWINRDGQLVALNSREHRVERDRETGDLVAYQKSSAEIAEQDAQPIARGLIAPFEIDDDGLKLAWPDLARNVGGLVGGAYSDPVGTAKAFGQGVVDSVHDAATAPVRAYRGEIPEDEMVSEAFNLGGMAMLGGFAAPRPTGSIGMGGRAAKEALDTSEAAPLRGYRGVNVGQEFGAHPEFGSDVIFASKSPSVASEFAFSGPQTAKTSPAVYPVDMRFSNPYIYNARGQIDELDSLAETAKGLGHDGLIVRNVKDTPDMRDDAPITDIYAALQPGTTYSATTGDLLFANAKTGAAVPLATKALEGQQSKGITGYHGSPHDYAAERLVRFPDGRTEYIVGQPDVLPEIPAGAELVRDFPLGRPRVDRVGSGEGAQAYGHGWYAAEGEGVARSYRDMRRQGESMEDFDKRSAANHIADFIEKHKDDPNMAVAVESARAEAKKLPPPDPGRMYEVRINADPEQFLDWDKPISQQHDLFFETMRGRPDRFGILAPNGKFATSSPLTREMADEFINDFRRGYSRDGGSPDDWKIVDYSNRSEIPENIPLYEALEFRSQDATKILADGGIPGVRYFDGMSRGAGEGSRNYVIFDPAIVDIVKKYGLAGAVALGALSQADAEAFAAQFGE